MEKLKALIKEAVEAELKENPLHPEDAEGHVRKGKIEGVLKRMQDRSWNHPGSKDQSRYETDRRSWIMGYQKAIKEVGEQLLDLLF